MTIQPEFTVTVEVDPQVSDQGDRQRPHFMVDQMPSHSWVGEWVGDDVALALQVAREFERWWSGRYSQYLEERSS